MTEAPFVPRVPEFKVPDPLPDGMARPTLAVIREVNLSANPNKITVRYSRANMIVSVPNPDEFADLLVALASSTYSYPNEINPEPKGEFNSPMSLHNDRYVYVVFILKRAKNWQFAEKYSAISIANSGLEGLYYEACHVFPSGHASSRPGPGAKVAYFIASAPIKDGVPKHYIDHINLHVDLLYENHRSERAAMPIIIDPDVRYPGGSGSP